LILGLACALGSAALFGVAAVMQAHAMRALPEGDPGLRTFARAALRSWRLLAVVAAYLAGFVLHAVALWLLPLYLAQASISLSLPVTAVVSAVVLHERLALGRWLAVTAVIAGLVLVALGAGSVEHTASAATLTGVGAGWLVVLAAGAPWTLKAGAGVLGAWSGLGYAGTAVTTRGLDADQPIVSALALVIVSALGLVAFWLYSVALGRADVASSTAPLIVMQTCIPALVGVVAFGDTVRAGWAAAVVAGLALSIAGAIHLGRQPGSALTEPSVRMTA
jgi:drug/metabolite transporter (DMT)-like permease